MQYTFYISLVATFMNLSAIGMKLTYTKKETRKK